MESLREPTLEFLLASRARTDSFVPIVWVSIPIANYTLWALVAIAFATFSTTDLSQLVAPLSTLAMAGFLASSATAYLVYALVNRRNTHMAREQALLEQGISSAKSRAPTNDLRILLPLSSAEYNFGRLSQASGERSAFLWALLAFVPYLGWLVLIYVLLFLSQDLKRHELSEELVIQDLDRSFRAAGNEALPVRERRSPYRNVVPYAALSLVFLAISVPGLLRALAAITVASSGVTLDLGPANLTLLAVGIVGLGVVLNLWLYQVLQDPREHFDYHRRLEASLFPVQDRRTPQPGGAI